VTEPLLASQAQQVYYVQHPSDSDWQFVITPSTRDFLLYDYKWCGLGYNSKCKQKYGLLNDYVY
jgi:hypothetical protein